MKDRGKTKEQLFKELKTLQGRLAKLERAETECKQAEEELHETKQMLENIFQGVGDGILLLSKDFEILYANKAILDETGYKIEDIVGKHCYEVTHQRESPCKPPHDPCPIYEVQKTSKPTIVPHTHFDEKGNKIFVEVSAYPLKDEKGKIVQYVHLTRDVTERRQAEEALKNANEELMVTEEELRKLNEELEQRVAERTAEVMSTKDLLEKVLDNTGEVIFSLDNSLTLTYWNREAERVLGYSKNMLSGKSLKDIGKFIEGKELVEILNRSTNRPVESETVLKTRDGNRRVFKFLITPLMNEKMEGEGFVVSGVDITLLKRFYKRLIPGNSYIIHDDGIDRACGILKVLKGEGFNIMIITRRSPEDVEGTWNLKASYLLLSGAKTRKYTTVKDLSDIKERVEKHLENKRKSAILLDRLDYLITLYEFKSVLPLLYGLNDRISESNSILLVNVPKPLLNDRENMLLGQELCKIPDLESLTAEEVSYDGYQILNFVVERDETTLRDIAKKFYITRPTVNKRIRELERKGLIKTQKKGRYIVLSLTENGKHLI